MIQRYQCDHLDGDRLVIFLCHFGSNSMDAAQTATEDRIAPFYIVPEGPRATSRSTSTERARWMESRRRVRKRSRTTLTRTQPHRFARRPNCRDYIDEKAGGGLWPQERKSS